MIKYATKYSHERYTINEINWSLTKNANQLYAYTDIDDALEEIDMLNDIVKFYKLLSSYQ